MQTPSILRGRRPQLSVAIAVAGVLGVGVVYAANTASAGTAQAPASQLRWSPDPAKDGLKAFAGVEDDRSHSEPGVTHIIAESTDYRYQMFIPSSLHGTTSFTHLFQVKQTNVGAPLVTLDLRRSGSAERIEMAMFGKGGQTIGSTDLAPLKNKWIDVEIEIKVADGTAGHLQYSLKDGGTTVVDATHTGDTWTSGTEAHPKWGIYRSIRDTPEIIDTYLLLRNLQAHRLQ